MISTRLFLDLLLIRYLATFSILVLQQVSCIFILLLINCPEEADVISDETMRDDCLQNMYSCENKISGSIANVIHKL
jgi:hypothetical protein